MPKRDPERYSEDYLRHHADGVVTRMKTWLERRALAHALELAGYPDSVLDIPCGTGRFWPTLVRWCTGSIVAMDVNPAMVRVALREAPEAVRCRVTASESSLFSIQAPDKSVEAVVSLRFFHHLAHRSDRLRALAELQRVARETLIVSIMTDGNLSAWMKRRRSRENLHEKREGYARRVRLPRRTFEWEARSVALDVIGYVDVLPWISKWRFYVLGLPRPS